MSGSSGSIMDNIAEGFGREGTKEFKQFLSYSIGSCTELRSQLYRCLDRTYLDKSAFDILNNEVIVITKRIKTLMNYLKTTLYKGNKFKEPIEEYISKHENQKN
jgi:four helix bundle protein